MPAAIKMVPSNTNRNLAGSLEYLFTMSLLRRREGRVGLWRECQGADWALCEFSKVGPSVGGPVHHDLGGRA